MIFRSPLNAVERATAITPMIRAAIPPAWMASMPGVAQNARAVAALALPGDTLAAVLAGNAARVYPGLAIP